MSDSEFTVPLAAPARRLRKPSRSEFRRVQQAARKKRSLRREAAITTLLPPEELPEEPMENIDSLTTIDLKKRFPISHRLVLKELSPWIAGFAVLIWLYWKNFSAGGSSGAPGEEALFASSHYPWQLYTFDEILLYASAFAILSVMASYYELQRTFFQYKIEGFRLVIRKGILLVEEGSLPLLPIAEVFVRRGVLDLIFGLYQVHIAVPVDLVKSFARIEGLSRKNAGLLIDFLSAQLSRQVTVAGPRGQAANDFSAHH